MEFGAEVARIVCSHVSLGTRMPTPDDEGLLLDFLQGSIGDAWTDVRASVNLVCHCVVATTTLGGLVTSDMLRPTWQNWFRTCAGGICGVRLRV